MQLDQSMEWMCWDNTESVTWTSRRRSTAGGDMTDTIRNVRRHMVSVKEAATSGGAYQAGDVLFYLPRAMIPVSIGLPKMGDWIGDDKDTRYTAISVDHRRRDSSDAQTFKVQARNLAIVFELEDAITIETPDLVLDETGAEKVTGWVPKYQDISARVQKISDSEKEERAIRGFEGQYAVYVDRELIVTLHDRIAWYGTPTSQAPSVAAEDRVPLRYLDVVGYRNAERIDELPVIDAVDKV